MKEININITTVGEIVANDFRSASVFKEAGIDFCCGGKKSIDESCKEKGISSEKILEAQSCFAFKYLRRISAALDTA